MTANAQPPDLARPLRTEERAEALSDLLRIDALLRRLAALVDVPEAEWPDEIASRLLPAALDTRGQADALRQWRSLFQDEVALVHNTRNRLVHQVKVSDEELAKAQVLARRLMEITFREL